MKKMTLRLMTTLSVFMLSATAFAQDAASNQSDVQMGYAFASALAIGLAAFGGSLGQGRAAAAALEGIARNPNAAGKMFVPFILALALIESLVIYALLIAGGFIGPMAG